MATSEANPRKKTDGLPLIAFVREHIEGLILRGELAAGDRINENALAAELQVSRGPIREVTRQLAEAGLVTIVPNCGVVVRKVSFEDVLHIYDVRAGLARVAGRLAALRATGPQIDKLNALWTEMEKAGASRDTDAYYEVNRRFHAYLFEISGNPRLIDFNAVTEREVFLFLRRGVVGPARLGASNQQHRQIIDAISAGDETAAAIAFENHVITGKQRMLDSLRSPASTPPDNPAARPLTSKASKAKSKTPT